MRLIVDKLLRMGRVVFGDLFLLGWVGAYVLLDVLIFFKIVPEFDKSTLLYKVIDASVFFPAFIIGCRLFWKNKLLSWKISWWVQVLVMILLTWGLVASGDGFREKYKPLFNFLIFVWVIVGFSIFLKIGYWFFRLINSYWKWLKEDGMAVFWRRMMGLVKIIFLIVALGAFYQVYDLTKRLDTVEKRFGGSYKVNCTEKESIEKVRRSVVRVVGGWSEGSGFAVDDKGTIVTNFHVIEFEPSPRVVLPSNSFKVAKIIMADKSADIALLKIDANLDSVEWGNSYTLDPAEELLAIGFPFGGQLAGESTVNKGFLAGRRVDKQNGVEYIQTDATLNPGVSGGPMINVCGAVVGMNTMGTAGLGLAITNESLKSKWLFGANTSEPLKDVKQIVFEPEKGPWETVEAFYNYIKIRKMEEAFSLLSEKYKAGISFENWRKGYEINLDTSLVSLVEDPKKEGFILVKLSTKDMIGNDIVVKYFEGSWEVRQIEGKWQLWDPEIKEVKDPDYFWFSI